jgi:superfamily I DNA/RNA helicase
VVKRSCKLPGIQDLSKEQEDARALPGDGQHLIIGGPGTGKSILALLRCRRHQLSAEDYVFLVYNKLLHQASRQLYGSELKSQQWQSWFIKLFQSLLNTPIPKLSAENSRHWQDIDWDGVLAAIGNIEDPPTKKPTFLIIDEGQDMPPQFYQSLTNLGFVNFYVVADQNQQIEPNKNSTRQEIQNALGIATGDVIELQQNYRNTFPIARLAREFYTGDPASPPPELPAARQSAIHPILFEYRSGQFQKLIGRILIMADISPGRLIGIITPNNRVRNEYLQALRDENVPLDNQRAKICSYQSGEPCELSFDEGGIMVINAQSCKGLEFDTVFLADIDQHYCRPMIAEQKKCLFYVMVARAIDRIVMLKAANEYCPIEAILPTDAAVLERK